jgi:hypothetical protein
LSGLGDSETRTGAPVDEALRMPVRRTALKLDFPRHQRAFLVVAFAMSDLDVLVAMLPATRQRDDVVDGEVAGDDLAADSTDSCVTIPNGEAINRLDKGSLALSASVSCLPEHLLLVRARPR